MLIEPWWKHLTTIRPHTFLGYQAPAQETIISAELVCTMKRPQPDKPSTVSDTIEYVKSGRAIGVSSCCDRNSRAFAENGVCKRKGKSAAGAASASERALAYLLFFLKCAEGLAPKPSARERSHLAETSGSDSESSVR